MPPLAVVDSTIALIVYGCFIFSEALYNAVKALETRAMLQATSHSALV